MGCPHGFSSKAWCEACQEEEMRKEVIRLQAIAKAENERQEREKLRQKELGETGYRGNYSNQAGKLCPSCRKWATQRQEPPIDHVEVKLTGKFDQESGTEIVDALIAFKSTEYRRADQLNRAADGIVRHFFASFSDGCEKPVVNYVEGTVWVRGPVKKDDRHSIAAIARIRAESGWGDGSLFTRIREIDPARATFLMPAWLQ